MNPAVHNLKILSGGGSCVVRPQKQLDSPVIFLRRMLLPLLLLLLIRIIQS